MTLYDRSQATEHIQFKSFSSMKSCGRQMRHRTKQDRRTKLSLKNVVLIIQTHDTTLTIRIAGLIKKKSTTLTVLVTWYKQTENQFENQSHFESENQSQVILIKMLLQIMTANLNIKINISTVSSLQ